MRMPTRFAQAVIPWFLYETCIYVSRVPKCGRSAYNVTVPKPSKSTLNEVTPQDAMGTNIRSPGWGSSAIIGGFESAGLTLVIKPNQIYYVRLEVRFH